MTQATVTVEAIFDPKPGKKNGAIAENRIYYNYDIQKFKFVKGQTYNIEYTTSDKGYHFIDRVEGQTYDPDQNKPSTEPSQRPAPDHQKTPEPASDPRILARTAIAAACIQANLDLGVAEMWADWVFQK